MRTEGGDAIDGPDCALGGFCGAGGLCCATAKAGRARTDRPNTSVILNWHSSLVQKTDGTTSNGKREPTRDRTTRLESGGRARGNASPNSGRNHKRLRHDFKPVRRRNDRNGRRWRGYGRAEHRAHRTEMCGRSRSGYVCAEVKLGSQEDNPQEQCHKTDTLSLAMHVLIKTKLRVNQLQGQAGKCCFCLHLHTMERYSM